MAQIIFRSVFSKILNQQNRSFHVAFFSTLFVYNY